MTIAYECGRRRSEIDGKLVSFLLVTGHVRKSVHGVWFCEAKTEKQADRLAKRWVFERELGSAVVPPTSSPPQQGVLPLF